MVQEKPRKKQVELENQRPFVHLPPSTQSSPQYTKLVVAKPVAHIAKARMPEAAKSPAGPLHFLGVICTWLNLTVISPFASNLPCHSPFHTTI